MYDNNNDPESNEFDLNSLRVGSPFRVLDAPSRQLRYNAFLKGPISWHWIKAATKAGRNALFIGLNLHRYRDLRRKTEVQISLQKLGDGVLSRKAVRHTLRQLEAAQLVTIRRSPGRLLAIGILDASEDS